MLCLIGTFPGLYKASMTLNQLISRLLNSYKSLFVYFHIYIYIFFFAPGISSYSPSRNQTTSLARRPPTANQSRPADSGEVKGERSQRQRSAAAVPVRPPWCVLTCACRTFVLLYSTQYTKWSSSETRQFSLTPSSGTRW